MVFTNSCPVVSNTGRVMDPDRLEILFALAMPLGKEPSDTIKAGPLVGKVLVEGPYRELRDEKLPKLPRFPIPEKEIIALGVAEPERVLKATVRLVAGDPLAITPERL